MAAIPTQSAGCARHWGSQVPAQPVKAAQPALSSVSSMANIPSQLLAGLTARCAVKPTTGCGPWGRPQDESGWKGRGRGDHTGETSG